MVATTTYGHLLPPHRRSDLGRDKRWQYITKCAGVPLWLAVRAYMDSYPHVGLVNATRDVLYYLTKQPRST